MGSTQSTWDPEQVCLPVQHRGQCDELEFTYDSETPTTTASFSVIWDQSKPLDNPDNIHVVIYKCEDMADNCESCLGIDQKYNCRWCQGHLSWWPESCKLVDECRTPLTC